MEKQDENKNEFMANEDQVPYRTFSSQEEADLFRLKRDMNRSDMEKFLLFTQMLRTNAMYKKAKISNNTTGE